MLEVPEAQYDGIRRINARDWLLMRAEFHKSRYGIRSTKILKQNAIIQPSLQVFLPIMSNKNLMLNLL